MMVGGGIRDYCNGGISDWTEGYEVMSEPGTVGGGRDAVGAAAGALRQVSWGAARRSVRCTYRSDVDHVMASGCSECVSWVY